jgi:hypothetical protein
MPYGKGCLRAVLQALADEVRLEMVGRLAAADEDVVCAALYDDLARCGSPITTASNPRSGLRSPARSSFARWAPLPRQGTALADVEVLGDDDAAVRVDQRLSPVELPRPGGLRILLVDRRVAEPRDLRSMGRVRSGE